MKEKYDNSVQMTIKNKRKRAGRRRSNGPVSTYEEGNHPNARTMIRRQDGATGGNSNNNRYTEYNNYGSNNNNNNNRYSNHHRSISENDRNIDGVRYRSKDDNHNRKRRKNEGLNPIIEAKKRELVFVHRSMNYCIEDTAKGILGTSGRVCSKDGGNIGNIGSDSCYLLCCGRGYNTMIKKVTTRCDCKFEWCCNVTCSVCDSETEVYTCK